MQKLQQAIPRQEPTTKHYNSWISKESYDLLDKKCNAVKSRETDAAKSLGKQLRRSIRKDRRVRIDKVADRIETLLDSGDIIGAFENLRSW